MAYGYTLSEEARYAYAAFADTPALDVIERLVDERPRARSVSRTSWIGAATWWVSRDDVVDHPR